MNGTWWSLTPMWSPERPICRAELHFPCIFFVCSGFSKEKGGPSPCEPKLAFSYTRGERRLLLAYSGCPSRWPRHGTILVYFIDWFLRSIWIWTQRTCPVSYFAPTCIVGHHVFTGLGMASSRRQGALVQITGIESFARFGARVVLALSYCMSLS